MPRASKSIQEEEEKEERREEKNSVDKPQKMNINLPE